MGRAISLSTIYSDKENQLIGYFGLVLKFIYNKDVNVFQKVISSLLQISQRINTTIIAEPQQEQENNTLELLPTQASYAIYFESQVSDRFNIEQIETHLRELDMQDCDVKIMFLISTSDETNLDVRIKGSFSIARNLKIILQPITYDDLLKSIEIESANFDSTFLDNMIAFRSYLDTSNFADISKPSCN